MRIAGEDDDHTVDDHRTGSKATSGGLLPEGTRAGGNEGTKEAAGAAAMSQTDSRWPRRAVVEQEEAEEFAQCRSSSQPSDVSSADKESTSNRCVGTDERTAVLLRRGVQHCPSLAFISTPISNGFENLAFS